MPDILFKDTAGTEPALYGDVIARIEDQSPNGNNALQATTAQRPLYTEGTGGATDRLVYDGVDDNMVVDFGAAFAGDVFQGTVNGILHYAISTAGTWQNPTNPSYIPDVGTLTATIAREGTLAAGDVVRVKTYLQDETGAGADFAGVTDMGEWFRGRTDITAICSGDWDTSSVTDFGIFAYGCSNLTTLDVSSWDTSSVTSFGYFAYGCSSLTTLDVSNWNTASVTIFNNFIQNCSSLTTLDVSNWNTSSVTNFGNFARSCSSLTTLDVSNWNTSSVTNFGYFAGGCSSLTTLDVSSWDTSSVTNFGIFAYGCSSLTTLDVSNWNTSSVTSFEDFAGACSSLTTVTVTGGTGNPFADSPCTNYTNAFINTNLTQGSIDDILVAIEAAGTSNGTFNQSGGSAPSATGEAAVTTLRGRGWTVTVTGGF